MPQAPADQRHARPQPPPRRGTQGVGKTLDGGMIRTTANGSSCRTGLTTAGTLLALKVQDEGMPYLSGSVVHLDRCGRSTPRPISLGHTGPMGSCLFYGTASGSFTKEHVPPKRIRALLEAPASLGVHRGEEPGHHPGETG